MTGTSMRSIRLLFAAFALVIAGMPAERVAAAQSAPVQSLKITVLSTMLADQGLGEWGYAALVEAGDRKILFDTGANPDLVLANARTLGIDLSQVEEAVISHNHWDHVGGLVTLRRELSQKNPRAMSIVHVGARIFEPRVRKDGTDANGLVRFKAEYEALGGRFVVHNKPVELAPGLWLTGPVARVHRETNWTPGLSLRAASGLVEDNVPEDMSLVAVTPEGLVILTGCGHAGIVNIIDHSRAAISRVPVLAVVGGLHLLDKDEVEISWTASKLKEQHVRYLLAGHCTGIEATFRLRSLLALDRRTAVVSAVGSAFELGRGITPGRIAR